MSTNSETKNTKPVLFGFIGIDKHDIMIYLSRIICKLSKKVLMVDCSESLALTESVPWRREEESNSRSPEHQTIIDYKGVHYLNYGEYNAFVAEAVIEQFISDEIYDCIFIDFGFRLTNYVLSQCDILMIVTDQQLHHIRRLIGHEHIAGKRRVLVIKDYCTCKINAEQVRRELRYSTEEMTTHLLPLDEKDTVSCICCQYDASVSFMTLSQEYKKLLLECFQMIFPLVSKNDYQKAYRKARKGV